MIMLKTEPFGNECTFGIKCDVCGEPILTHRDGVLFFKHHEGENGFIRTLCAHKQCQNKIPNVKSLESKDLTEFFEVFLPNLRFDEDS